MHFLTADYTGVNYFMDYQLHINSVLGDLELNNTSASLSDMVMTVYRIFEKDKTTPGLILLKDGQFHGLLTKAKFFEVMSKQFMYDLFSRRRIDSFFTEDFNRNYLILKSSTSIISATNKALNRDESDIFDPIIVKFGNNEHRLLDFYKLLVAQNKIQLSMNELLEQANEFKKEVLAITTHDLRNPIGTILGFTDLLLHENDIVQCKEFAGHIQKTAAQMEDLVKTFLVSTINDSIEYKLEVSNFDIMELLHSIIGDFGISAEKKKQKIVLEAENHQLNIKSDRLKIKEVIENLVSNAIKYSEEKMEIRVSLKRSDNYVEISVKDQGPGFSDSDLKKIYGKFQRLSARPTGNESSTGLGLFITQKIVNKLNGSIELETEPGKGSNFNIKLPLSFKTTNNETTLSQGQLNKEVPAV